jgi:5-formyltetrahydrofolate cyclo-ligase
MIPDESFTDFIKILITSRAAILYTPLTSEVNLMTLAISMLIPGKKIFLPADKTANPFVWAKKCLKLLNGMDVCVFIPGQAFDRHGTRHGRGFGWYDRFLSKIPAHWIRIGIGKKENFSQTAIKREPWDESMDWIIINDKGESSLIKTGARKLK